MDSVIQFENVFYSYSHDRFQLKDISFDIKEGEIFAVTGTNGTGKTTLLRLMIGLLTPDEGTVRIFGSHLTKKNAAQVRTQVGFVFQNPDEQLFATTIYEDVAFGPRNLGWSEEQVDAAVKLWLKIVGLPDIIDYSPYELSFGQKKRAALAGVFAMNPKVVLLDEPFAYLDLPSTITLIQLLTQIVEDNNVTVVFSSHNYSLVEKWADRMIVLNGGFSIFCGDSRIGFQDEALIKILGDPAELDNLSRKPKVSLMTNQNI